MRVASRSRRVPSEFEGGLPRAKESTGGFCLHYLFHKVREEVKDQNLSFTQTAKLRRTAVLKLGSGTPVVLGYIEVPA
jgi:hypothetical protein